MAEQNGIRLDSEIDNFLEASAITDILNKVEISGLGDKYGTVEFTEDPTTLLEYEWRYVLPMITMVSKEDFIQIQTALSTIIDSVYTGM